MTGLVGSVCVRFTFMIVPGAVMFEPLPTLPALVRSLPRVYPRVGHQLVSLSEPPPALITTKRFLSCVDLLVLPDLLIVHELLTTEAARLLVHLLVVSFLVRVSNALQIEPLTTLRAHELLSVLVRLHVALVALLPVEMLLTHFALEGL